MVPSQNHAATPGRAGIYDRIDDEEREVNGLNGSRAFSGCAVSGRQSVLINAVTLTFPADNAEVAASLLRQLRAASLQEPDCHGYDVSRCIDEPRVFVLHETYTDQAALDAHYASEHFDRFGKNGFRPLIESRTALRCSPLEQ